MLLATSFWDFLWSLIVIFFMVIYFMMLFGVIVDIFRRRDIGGFKKAVWLIFLLVLPLISLLTYMIVNGTGMTDRQLADSQRAQAQFDEHVRSVAAGAAADQIARAKELLDSGAITKKEYEQLKAKALS
jgi:predicted PurR-regulated permease PerM